MSPRRARFTPGSRDLLRRFWRDDAGSYIFIATLTMPVLVGVVALGTEAGGWMFDHRSMQSAADSSAFSAAAAYAVSIGKKSPLNLSQIQTQAWGVTATYGYTNGANNADVTVNWPYSGDQYKVEVIVAQPRAPLFSILWNTSPTVIRARAVAQGIPAVTTPGNGCVLALNEHATGALSAQGTVNIALNNCSIFVNSDAGLDEADTKSALTAGGNSSITVSTTDPNSPPGTVNVVGDISGENHIQTGDNQTDIKKLNKANSAPDPYADLVPNPVYSNGTWSLEWDPPYVSTQPCDLTKYTVSSIATIGPSSPNQLYTICNGLSVNGGATLNLMPGIYIFDQGDFQVNGGATVTGTGVTLIFTSHTGNNWATATINGGAVIDLSAPKPPEPKDGGPTKGLVFYGDRQMAGSGAVFSFLGGATQAINGAIYLPGANAKFAGGSETTQACTQLIADTITFTGNAVFKIGCSNGTTAIAQVTVPVVLLIE